MLSLMSQELCVSPRPDSIFGATAADSLSSLEDDYNWTATLFQDLEHELIAASPRKFPRSHGRSHSLEGGLDTLFDWREPMDNELDHVPAKYEHVYELPEPTSAPLKDVKDLYIPTDKESSPSKRKREEATDTRRPVETCADGVEQEFKRKKWSEDEMKHLWIGIAKYGNSWTDIKTMFRFRSYCQIKDKGRRCLFMRGWKTGRSKTETDASSVMAKAIAKAELIQQ